MKRPAFEEIDPTSDCGCPGCARLTPPPSPPPGPTPAHRVVIVAAAASTTLTATPALAAPQAPDQQAGPAAPGVPAADEPQTPQGGKAPLHGAAGGPAKPGAVVRTPPITRTEIINRAKVWVAAQVPYSMYAYWPDGYRQDCSGFVSMAWHLPGNEWTGSLGQVAQPITKEELQPGDILLFHNTADPEKGSHVVIFGGWTDYTHTYYVAYEQTRPATRRQVTPYPYWSNGSRYQPYRYKGVTDGAAGAPADTGTASPGATAFPGASFFGAGADNAHVTRLGQLLVSRGGARFYTSGPGPVWTDADRRATQAFQQAQGWTGSGADGLPGPLTWALLVSGTGKDIPPAGTPGPAKPPAPAKPPTPAEPGTPPRPAPAVPPFPGVDRFRPGANNAHVAQLGRQLVKKGFGRFYTTGPGPRWSEADRRAVEAFQLAQGWRGTNADGYPGPETWRRLFR
ncbi:peptidoglycan-binding protein [Streptomyces sp. NPDC014802]|uniref:peptidoglycan-binding protein n=1 Tax=Streptomyces sp. NPDC014802 TaxID=3364917 RepID=UPI0036FE3F18